MSVWDTLIGLTATALKNKPRSDVLDALLELRAAMDGCNKTYSDWQNMVKLGDYDSQIAERKELAAPKPGLEVYDPREEWEHSVHRLKYALNNISMTLRVFSPRAFKRTSRYVQGEVVHVPTKDPYEWPIKALNRYGARIDRDNVGLALIVGGFSASVESSM